MKYKIVYVNPENGLVRYFNNLNPSWDERPQVTYPLNRLFTHLAQADEYLHGHYRNRPPHAAWESPIPGVLMVIPVWWQREYLDLTLPALVLRLYCEAMERAIDLHFLAERFAGTGYWAKREATTCH